MFLDLPQEIIMRLFTGYLVILGYFVVCGWLLYGMRSAATDFRHRRELEDTELLYSREQ